MIFNPSSFAFQSNQIVADQVRSALARSNSVTLPHSSSSASSLDEEVGENSKESAQPRGDVEEKKEL